MTSYTVIVHFKMSIYVFFLNNTKISLNVRSEKKMKYCFLLYCQKYTETILSDTYLGG